MKFYKKPRGFTLIEVVAVVFGMSLLAGVVVPEFIASKTKSQAQTELANLRVIQAAKSRFMADYPGELLTSEEQLTPYLPAAQMPKPAFGGVYENVLDLKAVVTSPTLAAKGFPGLNSASLVYYQKTPCGSNASSTWEPGPWSSWSACSSCTGGSQFMTRSYYASGPCIPTTPKPPDDLLSQNCGGTLGVWKRVLGSPSACDTATSTRSMSYSWIVDGGNCRPATFPDGTTLVPASPKVTSLGELNGIITYVDAACVGIPPVVVVPPVVTEPPVIEPPVVVPPVTEPPVVVPLRGRFLAIRIPWMYRFANNGVEGIPNILLNSINMGDSIMVPEAEWVFWNSRFPAAKPLAYYYQYFSAIPFVGGGLNDTGFYVSYDGSPPPPSRWKPFTSADFYVPQLTDDILSFTNGGGGYRGLPRWRRLDPKYMGLSPFYATFWTADLFGMGNYTDGSSVLLQWETLYYELP